MKRQPNNWSWALILTAFLLASGIKLWGAEFQAVQHILQDSRRPVVADLAAYGIQGATEALAEDGKPLPSQKIDNRLYVDLPLKGLETLKFSLCSPVAEGKKASGQPVEQTGGAVSVNNGWGKWTIAADGSLSISRSGTLVAVLRPDESKAAAVAIKANGPLVTEVAWKAGKEEGVFRIFHDSPYFETDWEPSTMAWRLEGGGGQDKARLLCAKMDSLWGCQTYADDIERNCKQFDFLYPFDWAAVNFGPSILGVFPAAEGFRVNLQRVDTRTWRLRTASFKQLLDPQFKQWHSLDGARVTTYERFLDTEMPNKTTVALALLEKDAADGAAWHDQSLGAEVVQPQGPAQFEGRKTVRGVALTVKVADANGNGRADLWGDRWTWTYDGKETLAMAFRGEKGKMTGADVFAGTIRNRGIRSEKEASVPRIHLDVRDRSGSFCHGSALYGGGMASVALCYDAKLSGDFSRDRTLNYRLEGYDLNGDDNPDILYCPTINQGVPTGDVPQLFGGESGPFANVGAHRLLFGLCLDPATGFAYPMFPAPYVHAGDSLSHFWSLARNTAIPGWLIPLEGNLVGGHDWPQAVMDLNNDGYADTRFYTESFLMRKDGQPLKNSNDWAGLTFKDVDLRVNAMRIAMNLDFNQDGLTGPSDAHYFIADRARDWDVCLYPRRSVDTKTLRASLEKHGPGAVIMNGYTRFPDIKNSVYMDAYGYRLGFTGPNQPPVGWKGERVSYFDPKTGEPTGWGSGLKWTQAVPIDSYMAAWTDYLCGNKRAPEATHPGINNMNRMDADFYGRAHKLGLKYYFSPFTGRMHLLGANFGYEYTGEKSFEAPTVERDVPQDRDLWLGYQYWVWFIDPDTYLPGPWWKAGDPGRSRISYFDSDADGYYDTYLFSKFGNPQGAFDSVFQILPKGKMQERGKSPCLVRLAAGPWTGLACLPLDFRAATFAYQNIGQVKEMKQLVEETQGRMIQGQNKESLLNTLFVSRAEALPKAEGWTPGLFLKNARARVSLDKFHGGKRGEWENIGPDGYWALRSAFEMQGAETLELDAEWSDSSLAGVDVLIVNALDKRPTDGEWTALTRFMENGGKVLFSFAPGTEKQSLALLPKSLGLGAGEIFRTVELHHLGPKGSARFWYLPIKGFEFSCQPGDVSDVLDRSGRKLFFTAYSETQGVDQLAIRSGVTLRGGEAVLSYKEQPFLTTVKQGRGLALICGADDLFNNMCVSIALNPPRSMIESAEKASGVYGGACSSSFWNHFHGGITVRNNLARWLIQDKTPAVAWEGWNRLAIELKRPAEAWLPAGSPAQLKGASSAAEPRAGFSVMKLLPGRYEVTGLDAPTPQP